VTSSNSAITQGSFVTFTAQVNPPNPAGPLPTGAVQFAVNGSSIGLARISEGKAALPVNSLSVGSNAIVASYSGDANYTASTGTFTQTVNAAPTPAFSVSANPTSLTIPVPGQTVSTTLSFASQGNLTGSGGLSSSTCGISSAEEITCILSGFTLPPNGTAQATLTFSSTAATAIAPNSPSKPFAPGNNAPTTLLFAILCALAALALANQRRKDSRWNLVFGTLIFAILVTSVSCGGGGNSSSGGGGGGTQSNPGTPIGAVQPLTVSITVNGVTKTVSNLTVTVQ
jgi:hypothetical protein